MFIRLGSYPLWPDWAIFEILGDTISSKSTPNDCNLFEQLKNPHFYVKNFFYYFLGYFWKHLGYFLLQHLATLLVSSFPELSRLDKVQQTFKYFNNLLAYLIDAVGKQVRLFHNLFVLYRNNLAYLTISSLFDNK